MITTKKLIFIKPVKWGFELIVNFLLSERANVNLCNLFKETSLHKAKQKRHGNALLSYLSEITYCDPYQPQLCLMKCISYMFPFCFFNQSYYK